MKRSKFLKLKEYEWSDSTDNMEVGECFLMGEMMITQKEEYHEYVSYYVVTKITNKNNILMEVKMEKLED